MTDDSTFGNGMGFGGGLDVSAGQANGADVPPTPAPQPSSGGFGSGLSTMLGAPSYRAPDPSASPLDQTADTLQQRIQRANSIATNPMLAIFQPEGVAKARDFVGAATEKLQTIRTQQAQMKANRVQAENLGLHPGEVPDEATQADRVEVAKNRALKGDLRVFQGLQTVDPQSAAAIEPQVYEAIGGHITNAQAAFDKLSNVRNAGEYNAAVDEIRRGGSLADLEAMGLQIPKNWDAFNAGKAREGQALREAKIAIENKRSQLEDRNTYQPMEEKEAKTYDGRLKTASGDNMQVNWSRNASSNARGGIVNGMADPRKLGETYVLGSSDQRKAIKEQADGAVSKEDLEKYRAFNRTYQLATTDEKGNNIPRSGLKDAKGNVSYFNTNPNVQQGVAEGLASMLRGGGGGANKGLLNIETDKRGYIQGLMDKIKSAHAGGINTLTGEQVMPYLTQLTQSQIRDVLDVLKGYNDSNISDRLGPAAERAGQLFGHQAESIIGFGKGESAGPISDAIERGKQDTIARIMPYHQAIGNGDGVIQIGAQRPGAGATALNPGAQSTTTQPGAQPLLTPAQQATASPPAAPGGGPAGPTPPGPAAPGGGPGGVGPAGGGPTAPQGGPPVQIAGQSITAPMPPGASPAYLQSAQRIESGDEKTPWTAGTPKSSASGAFQFTDATWKENAPPGAPARAKDATPQQQAQAMTTFTTKNAAKLTAAGIPVNDVNLYVMHNIGEGSGPKLLHADPNADARKIVGDAAANNNPMFYKGRPTVATVLQRYAQAMAGDGKPPAVSNASIAALPDVGAAPWTGRTTPTEAIPHVNSPEERANSPVVNMAPAIGSTAGSLAGTLAGGPVGGAVGGAAGGGAGQAFQDYMKGNEQDPKKIAKQSALGLVLGIAPESAPLIGAAARVGGAAAVDAGATALEGGDTGDVVKSGLEGGGYALGGEVLGRFISSLGPAAHRVLSNYTSKGQTEISEMAGKLSEARKTLETEEPKIAGAEGASAPNPKYDAAKATEEAATKYIKDHNQNPDDMVYAYDQAKEGVSSGEAFTMRKANTEKSDVGAGYEDLRKQVKDTGVGAPKPNQQTPGGPVSMLRTADNPTGKVPEQFRPEAEHAEMLVKAPAKDWGEKWTQLQNAGSELIKKRMDFLAAGDKSSAEAMDNLFQGVRNQQKAAAEYVFGAARGKQIISNLENLDTRYAKVMNATAGMSYKGMQSVLAQGNTPAARELEKNFTEFAKGDPTALRAFNAMKAGARGDWKSEANLMLPIIAGEVSGIVPTAGVVTAAVGGYRLAKYVQAYMNARILSKTVTFKDFLQGEIQRNGGISTMAAQTSQRAAVQGAQ